MKDDRGLYYHPAMQDKRVRMYVREQDGKVQFRLWNSEHEEVWERHQWLDYEVIEAAAEMYRQRDADRNPLALYDLDVAKRLIADEK